MQSTKSHKQISALIDLLDKVIIGLTLAALAALPLIFSYFDFSAIFNEPKVLTLHLLSGLILICWSWQIVLQRISSQGITKPEFDWDLFNWAGRNPARWALLGAALWFFSIIASTILSPLPIISFFGGDEGRTGYNLYNNLSLMVIFASIAVRFRTNRSLELLAYTLVITGTIAAAYGILQHFGWDPIGGNEGRRRAISSFGNTLNFGAYMVMSIPATLAIIYKQTNRKWTYIVLVTVAVGLQITGLWFTGGRGPFVATAVSIISFFLIALPLITPREIFKAFAVLIVSTVIAAVIIAIPSEQGDIGLERAISISNQFSSETTSTDIEGGLVGRFNIWGSMMKQATQWKVPIEEPAANTILRPIFGIGPDMLVYVYPLIGQPQSRLALVDHAHNYPLQVMIEHGFLGLLGFLTMVGFLIASILMIIIKIRASGKLSNAHLLIILALMPAMIGKMIEMQTGVGRISDLSMNFALFGGTIAMYEIISHRIVTQQSEKRVRNSSENISQKTISPNHFVLISWVGISSLITLIVISLFVSWDLRRFTASRSLALGWDDPVQTERADAWADAQKRAPERESFTFTLFETYLKVSKEQFEKGNTEEALRLLSAGRDMLLEYEKRDPFELDIQIGLSKSVSTLMEWGYLNYAQELKDRSIKLAENNPAYPSILGTAATALTSVNEHELAIKYADAAIATESTTKNWSKAWYAKGRALYELQREQEAIDTLITATEKQPGSEGSLLAHQVLAQIYGQSGQSELAERHKIEGAKEIKVVE